MKSKISSSQEETSQIAAEWLQEISANAQEGNGAKIVGLSGHLGAGKTAFVKALAKVIGVKEEITSPTFVIMKIYETGHNIWKRLVHIDAYRLESPEEMVTLDWENIVANSSNLVMVEWPENVGIETSIQFQNISDSEISIQFLSENNKK